MVEMLRRQGRRRVDLDADRADFLAGKLARAQVGDVVGGIDAARVGVGGAVREQILHGEPQAVEEPTVWAVGTCEK